MMKTFFTSLFIIVMLVQCTKSRIATENPPYSIIGNWNLQSDSTFTGVGTGNHAFDYNGQTGDYFDLRNDGNVYVKEGSILDTLPYRLLSDSTIIISSFGITSNGVHQVSNITNLTAHTAVITAANVYTPGGAFGRNVHLTR